MQGENNAKSAGKRTPWRREKKGRAKDKRCCLYSPKADPAILSNCAAITDVWQHEFSICLSYRFAQGRSTTCGSRTRKGRAIG